jgi:hypothetical protein
LAIIEFRSLLQVFASPYIGQRHGEETDCAYREDYIEHQDHPFARDRVVNAAVGGASTTTLLFLLDAKIDSLDAGNASVLAVAERRTRGNGVSRLLAFRIERSSRPNWIRT